MDDPSIAARGHVPMIVPPGQRLHAGQTMLDFPGRVLRAYPKETIGSVTEAKYFYSSRQGDRSFQWRIASVAQAVLLSEWQEVHGLGILYLSVITGLMNLKVCA
jgi:hypothetical protein